MQDHILHRTSQSGVWARDGSPDACLLHCCAAHAGKPRAGGGITLGLLIDEGILAPGENCLTVEYKSSMTYATLMPDGRISCHVRTCLSWSSVGSDWPEHQLLSA